MISKKVMDGILIFVAGAIILAIIGGVFSTFLNQRDYQESQKRIKEDVKELKKSYKIIIEKTTEGNKNISLLALEITHLATAVKELKAEVKGSYAKRIEESKSKIRTDEQNMQIVLSSL